MKAKLGFKVGSAHAHLGHFTKDKHLRAGHNTDPIQTKGPQSDPGFVPAPNEDAATTYGRKVQSGEITPTRSEMLGGKQVGTVVLTPGRLSELMKMRGKQK